MRFKPLVGVMVAISFGSQALAQTSPAAPPAPAAGAPAAAPPALSDSLTGEAKGAYDDAKLLYRDGDYAGAVLKFQRAYDLSKDPRLLWNLAGTEKFLRHYTQVEGLLQRYLTEAGTSLSDEDRSNAQNLLTTMRTFIADVSVNVNQPGAAILVDDAEVATTPLAKPLRVDMGPHVFKVKKPGFSDFTATRTLPGGGVTSLDVTLVAQLHEGRLRVSATQGDTIRVDGKIVASSQWEAHVPSGAHRVDVSAPGKQSWHSDSLVQDGQLTTVLVTLSQNPAATKGIPAWIWIAGGAVVAAGLGTGAYFLFRPADKGPPAPIEGSLDTVELPFRM